MKSITRAEAIRLIAVHDLKGLSSDERADELYELSATDWEDDPYWQQLPKSLRREIEEGEFNDIDDPSHARFDQALMISMCANYGLATNAYLLKMVKQLNDKVCKITGVSQSGISCPCCGLQTLEEREMYQICSVCWWEDDGQDNDDAHIDAAGGPNKVSLTQGRINYLLHGICEPKRTDLIKLHEPTEKYAVGRKFMIDDTADIIYEVGAGWKTPLK